MINHATLAITFAEVQVGDLGGALVFHDLHELHELDDVFVILLTGLALTSLNHRQSLKIVQINRFDLGVELHLSLCLATRGGGGFYRRSGVSFHIFARELAHTFVHILLVLRLLLRGAGQIELVVLLDLLEGLWEEFPDGFLLKARARANAGVAAVVELSFRVFCYARIITLLLLLLVLRHDVRQVDVALIAGLTCVR